MHDDKPLLDEVETLEGLDGMQETRRSATDGVEFYAETEEVPAKLPAGYHGPSRAKRRERQARDQLHATRHSARA